MISENLKGSKLSKQVALAVSQGNFPHGVLIECENQDVGENFARFTACCLVCQGEEKPCGVCPACRKYENGGHPDVIETDGITGKSKNFTVDSIREIRSNAFVIPNESDKKIYILKNAHNMNEQAQNALLKILEEPPSYVYFILVSASKSAMLETILSRVSVYSLLPDYCDFSEGDKENIKSFVDALLSVNELSLLEFNAVFRKNSQQAKNFLALASQVFMDAIVKKNGFSHQSSFQNEVDRLCSSLSLKALMNCEALCEELSASVDRNCNNNLLITRMCYEFKRAIGR